MNNILNGDYSKCFKRAGKLKNCDYLVGNLETPVAGFDKPSYNAVFHLELSKNEQGKIETKKAFSIYTTMTDKNGVPIIIDSSDLFAIKDETHLFSDVLHYANLFAGEEKYTNIQERYEL